MLLSLVSPASRQAPDVRRRPGFPSVSHNCPACPLVSPSCPALVIHHRFPDPPPPLSIDKLKSCLGSPYVRVPPPPPPDLNT